MKAKSAVKELNETRFENRRLIALGIEPMSLSELRGKVTPQRLAPPERVDFYMLLLVTAGRGAHTVDFIDWPLAAGTLIFVRPGQVQQWHVSDDIAAQLVLIAPSTLPYGSGLTESREVELLALDEWQACTVLPEHLATEITEALLQLRRDFDHFDAGDLEVSMIRHELLTLLLRLARWQCTQLAGTGSLQGGRAAYRLFLRELEASFRKQHSLQYYAKRLGYAESTLSRACLAAEGRSAKEVIDRRVALEGQRMLAHSTASVAKISHYLGFSESTNFVKFFCRMTGTTPSVFREETTAITKR